MIHIDWSIEEAEGIFGLGINLFCPDDGGVYFVFMFGRKEFWFGILAI